MYPVSQKKRSRIPYPFLYPLYVRASYPFPYLFIPSLYPFFSRGYNQYSIFCFTLKGLFFYHAKRKAKGKDTKQKILYCIRVFSLPWYPFFLHRHDDHPLYQCILILFFFWMRKKGYRQENEKKIQNHPKGDSVFE